MIKMTTKIAALILLCLSFTSFAAQQVDINTADAKTIAQAMKGIGEAKAELIVQYRKDHGLFKNVDELVKVKGIGEKTVEKNRANIVAVQPEKTAALKK